MNQTQQPMQPQGGTSKWLWIVLIIVILGAAGYFTWYYVSGNKTDTTTPATTNTTSKTTTTTPSNTTITSPSTTTTTPSTNNTTTTTTPPSGWTTIKINLHAKSDTVNYVASVYGKDGWQASVRGSSINYTNYLIKADVDKNKDSFDKTDYYARLDISAPTNSCSVSAASEGISKTDKAVKTTDGRGCVQITLDGITLSDTDKKIILDSITISPAN